jgi:very-short-patch-repair endonuclease
LKNSYIPYKKSLKQNSRNLRNNSTLAEVILWSELKAGKMDGYKFNRQKPLGKFIVDFYCKKLNLVIEIDGESHLDKVKEDIERQKELEKFNLNFLRFDDLEVKMNLYNVICRIKQYINDFQNG